MRTYDFSPFARSAIGFERLFDLLNAQVAETPDNFPPYDIVRTGEDTFRISVALAGFAASEITVTTKQNMLVVTGRKAAQEGGQQYIYQGVSSRPFERRFNLADYIVVESAIFENGMLHINLVRHVPEAMKPRRIEITSPSPGADEGKSSAGVKAA